MNREEFYQQLPRLLVRLLTFGILGATLFLVFWYFGGVNVWGAVLLPFLKLVSGYADISQVYGTTSTAVYHYNFVLQGGPQVQLSFDINQLNSTLVEVVTLAAMWSYRNVRSFLRVTLFSFLLIVAYHCFQVWIQLYYISISDEVANRFGVFWESSNWFVMIKNIAAFDKFILRYWAGVPVFFLAVAGNHFWQRWRSSAGTQTSRKKTRSGKK